MSMLFLQLVEKLKRNNFPNIHYLIISINNNTVTSDLENAWNIKRRYPSQ